AKEHDTSNSLVLSSAPDACQEEFISSPQFSDVEEDVGLLGACNSGQESGVSCMRWSIFLWPSRCFLLSIHRKLICSTSSNRLAPPDRYSGHAGEIEPVTAVGVTR